MNVDVINDSRRVRLIGWRSGEDKPIRVVRNANKKFSLTIIRASDRAND